jgi:hypothetical protein
MFLFRVLKVFSLHHIIAWRTKLRNWFCLSLQTPGIPFIKLRVVETLVGKGRFVRLSYDS